MTSPVTRSPLRWSASWAAAASALPLLVAGACGTPDTAAASPSPPTVASPTAVEVSPTPSDAGTPVPKQVLAPASDLPVSNLCTAPVTFVPDGNVRPVLCTSGAVNVKAWQFYADISASVLGLGLNPTQGQVESAICDDFKHNHATVPEESSGYLLATTYYGWSFNINVASVSCP